MTDKTWIDVQKASRILDLTAGRIYSYHSQGLLRGRKEKGRLQLFLRDVVGLKRMKEYPDLYVVGNLKSTAILSRLQQVEREIELLKRVIQVEDPPLDLNPSTAVVVYTNCVIESGQRVHGLDSIRTWAAVIGGIQFKSLQMMYKHVEDSHPWRPFLDLADKMMDSLVHSKHYDEDLERQMLYSKLRRARDSMRQEAVLLEAELGQLPPALTAPEEPETS